MKNQHKPQYTVTFDEKNEYFYSSDSGEGIRSDEEPSQAEKSLSKTSSAPGIGCEGGDMQSASSISTSILDEVEEVKMLKGKIADLDAKNKLLNAEIEKVNLCLINERTKTSKLEKKLQFVKDNQDVFIKLKEAYINMKYNEAVGRKMVEIREKGMQTWEGILCRGCIDAEQLRRQLESVQQTYKDSFFISPLQLEQLLSTVKYLKELVDRRESSWSELSKRDEMIQVQLQRLERENYILHDLLRSKDGLEEDEAVNTDLGVYKKIIVKYEKKMRELERTSQGLVKYNITFNEKEKKIIHYLMLRYFSRLNEKRSNCNTSNDEGIVRKSGMKSDTETGDATLKLMNYILDSNEDGNVQTD